MDYDGSIFFVGTATVLIRFGEITLCTDPNFLHRHDVAHLGYGLTSRRLTNPAIEIEQLPPLDGIVLSHLHEDHFDRIAEARLDRSVPIFTNPKAADALANKGFLDPRAIRTWDTRSFQKGDLRLDLTALPAQHGPRLVSKLLPPVMGSMLDFSTESGDRLMRIYVSGDTVLHDELYEIPRRYPDVDLALLHLGGTRILGIYVTMDAREGLTCFKVIDPHLAIPIHYNDYTVFKSPLADFQKEVHRAGLDHRVRYLAHGQAYRFTVTAPGPYEEEPAPQSGV